MPYVASSLSQTSPRAFTDNSLLFTTLGLAVFSLFCSAYTTLRTLLPLLPPHPLNRRTTGSAVGPYDAPPSLGPNKPLRLKSAQRFTVWLAAVDIVAACVIVWESAMAVSSENGLGGSKGGASRLYVSCTIRPTLLVVVAVLSYANVVQGRSIALGRLDWIVWGPALCILTLGAGLASVPQAGNVNVWIGLVVWLTVVTGLVTLCFGRLLIAILRVRASTQRHRASSPWAQEQERMTGKSSSTYRAPASYLPPLHSNFSGLTASFCNTVGRSTSTLDLSSATMNDKDVILSFSSANMPAVGYAPSRPSVEDDFPERDFRSPTPGSTRGLLSSRTYFDPVSPVSAPSSAYSTTPKGGRTRFEQAEPHEIISFEEIPRPSFGSYASTSTGGFVGGPAMRQAITQEVWGDSARESPMPGSGSPKVELSQKETRGALIRLGGHLVCSIFGSGLVAPFLFLRIASPSTNPPLVASILLVAGVCQSGCILAMQTAMSEGLLFSTDKPPVLTSSSAATLEGVVEHRGEMVERPESRASSLHQSSRKSVDRVPGIQCGGVDCEETRRGRIGRAMSMIYPHPKLLVLPASPQAAGPRPKSAAVSGGPHARLRSLTLTNANRQRSSSTASRATVAGFEHIAAHEADPTPKSTHRRSDERLTRSLLAARRSFAGDGRVPFGFGTANKGEASPSPANTPTTAESAEFGLLRTREFTLSPPDSPAIASSSPTDFSIDFLSSQLIPRLVPGTKVGKHTLVGSEHAPLPPRRPAEQPPSTSSRARMSGSLSSIGFGQMSASSRNRNTCNLSLPGMPSTWTKFSKSDDEAATPSPRVDEAWIEVDQKHKTPIATITEVVRGKTSDKSLRHRSWKDRTAKAWDAVEAQEAATETSTAFRSSTADQSEERKVKRRSLPKLPIFTEGEEFETEVLDERTVESFGSEEAARAELDAYQRATSPSPSHKGSFGCRGPSSSPLFAESVVLRGSRVVDDDDDGDEDGELGVIQCATIRPISRVSSDGSTGTYSLRPTNSANESRGSVRSFASQQDRSLTSQGFHNVLEGRTWHTREDSSGVSSSDESSAEQPLPARRTSGLRPLRLLAQRDSNGSYDGSSASDRESDDGAKKQPRRSSTGSTERRRSWNIVPPPVPATIEELDEDKKSSGTPTPRAARLRQRTPVASAEETRRTMQRYLPDMGTPMSSTPPPSATVTPPAPYSPEAHVTTRTRAREHQRKTDSRNENVAPPLPSWAPLSPRPRTRSRVLPTVEVTGSSPAGIRAMR